MKKTIIKIDCDEGEYSFEINGNIYDISEALYQMCASCSDPARKIELCDSVICTVSNILAAIPLSSATELLARMKTLSDKYRTQIKALQKFS